MIQVKDLTKKYNGFTAVDNVSFNVAKAEKFAFLGPNGAGKTTTIKMLTTLLKPTSGEIRINDFDPLIQQMQVRKSFGIVFQDQSLDDELTTYENLDFHGVLYHVKKELRKQRIEQMLKMMELWDRRKDVVKTFSGGMKRRLEIARSFIHHPKVLFLDEPTLGLDPQTRNLIWSYIKELNQKEKMTVFFTTHNMEEAQNAADRICIIDHGKVQAIGTLEQLLGSHNTQSLEQVFLNLTGKSIRDENSGSIDEMRMARKVWK